jgi:hypothetical protein
MPKQEVIERLVAVALGLGGVAAVAYAFLGKEFHLVSLGGGRGPRLPTWLGRPLVLLVGVAALVLSIGPVGQHPPTFTRICLTRNFCRARRDAGCRSKEGKHLCRKLA